MTDNFQYGRCLPWRATISTEFCRIYKTGGRDKCQTCEGLLMDANTGKTPETSNGNQAGQRPPFKNLLKALMTAKPAKAKEVGRAVGLSTFSVYGWLKGTTVPSVSQARSLDEFFGTSLATEYEDFFRHTEPAEIKAGDDKAETDAEADDRQTALAILDKVLECLSLILAERATDCEG